MFALHDCSVPCVFLLYLYIVCLERGEQENEEEEEKGNWERKKEYGKM